MRLRRKKKKKERKKEIGHWHVNIWCFSSISTRQVILRMIENPVTSNPNDARR